MGPDSRWPVGIATVGSGISVDVRKVPLIPLPGNRGAPKSMAGTSASAASAAGIAGRGKGACNRYGLRTDAELRKLLMDFFRAADRTGNLRHRRQGGHERFEIDFALSAEILIHGHGGLLLRSRDQRIWLARRLSARNFSKPISVKGCLRSWAITWKGTVATSAPMAAASRRWMGLRTLATSTWVGKS